MDSKNLMIGDWVYVQSYGNKRIVSIGQNTISFIEDDKPYLVPSNVVEPIPLTEEILKANDLLRKRVIAQECYSDAWIEITAEEFDENGDLYFFSSSTVNSEIKSIFVDYVHQLQHLLRQEELDDLADNFKIE